MDYYNGNKLLSLKDINGNTPSIYISATNRTAGKTTFYNRLLVNNFLRYKKEFIIYYRYKKDLYDVPTKFFEEIGRLFFKKHVMRSTGKNDNPYITLTLDDNVCGYAVALNSAEDIKRCSHVFCLVDNTILDEFQSEDNKYLPDEVKKYISIQNSIARGNGQHVRYVRNFLVGNHMTLLNPYYIALGLHKKLTLSNVYTRGVGYVCETNFYENIANQVIMSPFNQAFSQEDNAYINTLASKKYLNDCNDFLCNLSDVKRYVCTLITPDKKLGVWDCGDKKIVSVKYDYSHPIVCAKKSQPILSNKIKSDGIYLQLRKSFEKGQLYFDTLEAKNLTIESLGY